VLMASFAIPSPSFRLCLDGLGRRSELPLLALRARGGSTSNSVRGAPLITLLFLGQETSLFMACRGGLAPDRVAWRRPGCSPSSCGGLAWLKR